MARLPGQRVWAAVVGDRKTPEQVVAESGYDPKDTAYYLERSGFTTGLYLKPDDVILFQDSVDPIASAQARARMYAAEAAIIGRRRRVNATHVPPKAPESEPLTDRQIDAMDDPLLDRHGQRSVASDSWGPRIPHTPPPARIEEIFSKPPTPAPEPDGESAIEPILKIGAIVGAAVGIGVAAIRLLGTGAGASSGAPAASGEQSGLWRDFVRRVQAHRANVKELNDAMYDAIADYMEAVSDNIVESEGGAVADAASAAANADVPQEIRDLIRDMNREIREAYERGRGGRDTSASRGRIATGELRLHEPGRLNAGQTFRADYTQQSLDPVTGHPTLTSGVTARLELDGTLHLNIKVGPGTKTGGEMFAEVMEAYGSNVKRIEGCWYDEPGSDTNFLLYRGARMEGLSPIEAANRTFTAEMARRYGFVVKDAKDVNDGIQQVFVIFRRIED